MLLIRFDGFLSSKIRYIPLIIIYRYIPLYTDNKTLDEDFNMRHIHLLMSRHSARIILSKPLNFNDQIQTQPRYIYRYKRKPLYRTHRHVECHLEVSLHKLLRLDTILKRAVNLRRWKIIYGILYTLFYIRYVPFESFLWRFLHFFT